MPFRTRPSFAAFLDAADSGASWSQLRRLAPELARLETCRQDPKHHAEGDVATHTRMVLEALRDSAAWAEADEEERSLLFWTAALHDVGKPATTRRNLEGRWSAPGHARAGARIARRLLWEAGAPTLWREAVASLVAAHMKPFHLIEEADPRRASITIAESLIGRADARLLIAQAEADALGRNSDDQGEIVERVALAMAVFEEHQIHDRGWLFGNAPSRVAFFAREGRDPHYLDIAPRRASVTLLAGLPGVGKDNWIAAEGAGRPVVSLDAIRARLGAPPTGDQGAVIQAAVAEAKDHLRVGRPFIWNATNLTRALRRKPLALFRDYAAAVEIVYLETDATTLRDRNRRRKTAVPEAALDRLADKVEPPDGREAEAVRWIVDGREFQIAG